MQAAIEVAGEVAVYDVVVTSSPPEDVRRRFPAMWVRGVGIQTALRREVRGPDQLDEVLAILAELRLPLVDLHLLGASSGAGAGAGAGAVYEIRVDGEVGESLLRYLRWSHRVVPAHARVRLPATARELTDFLVACSESGAGIERVHRLGQVNRGRAAEHAVPRPPCGSRTVWRRCP